MIEELPQNQLVERINALEKFMREFKNKQITAGASLVFSLYDYPGSYQWSGYIDQPGQGPGTYVKEITVSYNAPHQDHVYADLIAEFYIGDFSHKWSKVNDFYLPSINMTGNYYNMDIFITPQTLSNSKLAQWKIVLTSNDNATLCYLKLSVVSSDKE